MRKVLTLTLFLSFALGSCKQTSTSVDDIKRDKIDIESILHLQANAWNQGSLEEFMEGYWNSEDLRFIGSKGLTKGWQTTLNNYKSAYPDLSAMGKLSFEVIELNHINEGAYYMVGRYTLVREEDQPTGIFMLIWKKINGDWKIIADQTCG